MPLLVYAKLDRAIVRMINRARLLRLRLLGANVGANVRVYGRFSVLGDARKLCIGEGSTINEGVLFDLRECITIGQHVRLSAYVQLRTSKLRLDIPRVNHCGAPVTIGDHVWLASGVVVSPGVVIGSGAVVAANAVVIRDVPDHTLSGGVPARVLRGTS